MFLVTAMTTITLNSSVPDHGQGWAAAHCTPADTVLCYDAETDPNYADRLDWTAFEIQTGRFFQMVWLTEDGTLNKITEPNGQSECWTYDGETASPVSCGLTITQTSLP